MTLISRLVGFVVVGGCAVYGFVTIVGDILQWREDAMRSE